MRSSLLFLAVTTLTGLAGCSSSDEEVATVAVARSALARDTAPDVSAADRATFSADRADFSLDLLRKVASAHAGSNVVISPHSASIALAMTYAGSTGETKSGLASGLRFTLPEATTHAAFDATDLALATRSHAAASAEAGAVELSLANSVWSPSRAIWEPAYLDTLARSYGAGVNQVDFTNPAPAARAINGWVSDHTHAKITELVNANGLKDAVWVLVNAVYLKANWAHRFEKTATLPATFHAPSGDVSVPTMIEETKLRAVHRDDYDAVELPYDGGDLAMVIVAPRLGAFDATVTGLHGRDLLELPLADATVRLRLPKFEVRTNGDLTAPLGALGMPTKGEFPGGADEITVVQQAWLAADEAGTEAAAATAVIGAPTSAELDPPQPLEIDVDRPFLYAVVDKPTGAILFLGETLDPSTK